MIRIEYNLDKEQWGYAYLFSLTSHIAWLCKVKDVYVRFDEDLNDDATGESHWPDDKGFNFKRITMTVPKANTPLTRFKLILALTHEMCHVAEMQSDPKAKKLEWSFRKKKGPGPHSKRPEELRVSYKTLSKLLYDNDIETYLL